MSRGFLAIALLAILPSAATASIIPNEEVFNNWEHTSNPINDETVGEWAINGPWIQGTGNHVGALLSKFRNLVPTYS